MLANRLSTPLAARAQSHARELSRALTGVSRPLVPSDAQQQQQQHNNVCRSVQRSTAVQIRQRHSQTQVKRLFKNHPARARVFNRLGMEKRPGVIPERKYPAVPLPRCPNGRQGRRRGRIPPGIFRLSRSRNEAHHDHSQGDGRSGCLPIGAPSRPPPRPEG